MEPEEAKEPLESPIFDSVVRLQDAFRFVVPFNECQLRTIVEVYRYPRSSQCRNGFDISFQLPHAYVELFCVADFDGMSAAVPLRELVVHGYTLGKAEVQNDFMVVPLEHMGKPVFALRFKGARFADEPDREA